jgi:hypothetical protein
VISNILRLSQKNSPLSATSPSISKSILSRARGTLYLLLERLASITRPFLALCCLCCLCFSSTLMETDDIWPTDLSHPNPSFHHDPSQPSINTPSLASPLESFSMGQSNSISRAEISPVETPLARSQIPSMVSDDIHQPDDIATSQTQEQSSSRRLRRRTRNVISQGPGSTTTPSSSQSEPYNWRGGRMQPTHTTGRAPRPLDAPLAVWDDPLLTDEPDLRENPGQTRPSTFRQSSYMTRMASRLMPRYTTASSTDTEDDTREEGRAVRRRLSDRFSMAPDIQFDPVRYDSTILAERRRRIITRLRNRTPLGPSDLPAQERNQPENRSDGTRSSTGARPIEPPTSANGPATLSTQRPSTARSRFSSLRNSIHLSLTRLATPPDRASIFHETDAQSESPRLQMPASASDTFLPRLPTPNLGLDLDPTRAMTPLHLTNPTPFRPPTPPPRRLTPPPPPDGDVRRLPHALRGGPTRPRPGEDQAAMLSRLLSHAAALTAVSLVGDNQHALSDARDVGGDNVDGSFEGFLQALQNGRLAAALRNGGSEMGGGSAAANGETNVTPVNFFRMFRFGTIGGGTGGNTSTNNNSNPVGRRLRRHQNQTAPSDAPNEEEEGRMVPVIIVGIRSMTSEEGAEREGGNTTPPFFDMLQDLAMEDEAPRGRAGGFLRRTDGRSRFSRSRRPSLSSTFPANYDSQRHHRGNTVSSTSSQPEAIPTAGTSLMSLPTVLSDTPPGPNPPPTTPADPSLSALSSGTTTPNRQSSTSSANHTPLFPNHARENGARRQTSIFEPTEEESHASPRNPRRRRVSDSEFSRYRNYGLGSSRRNGMVGDSGPSTEGIESDSGRSRRGQTETTNRSWIIYVLGGSYPEDHPILTTPSLFTDVSSKHPLLLLCITRCGFSHSWRMLTHSEIDSLHPMKICCSLLRCWVLRSHL